MRRSSALVTFGFALVASVATSPRGWNVEAYEEGAPWEVTTAYAGLMLNIDAYDQPAVETGKVATFGLMGRSGYEQWRENVERALPPSEYLV